MAKAPQITIPATKKAASTKSGNYGAALGYPDLPDDVGVSDGSGWIYTLSMTGIHPPLNYVDYQNGPNTYICRYNALTGGLVAAGGSITCPPLLAKDGRTIQY